MNKDVSRNMIDKNLQLLSRRSFLIPGRNLDGPNFAKPYNGRDQNQHKVPSERINYQCTGILVLAYLR